MGNRNETQLENQQQMPSLKRCLVSTPGSHGVNLLSWQGHVVVLLHPLLSKVTVSVQGSPTVMLGVNSVAGAYRVRGLG